MSERSKGPGIPGQQSWSGEGFDAKEKPATASHNKKQSEIVQPNFDLAQKELIEEKWKKMNDLLKQSEAVSVDIQISPYTTPSRDKIRNIFNGHFKVCQESKLDLHDGLGIFISNQYKKIFSQPQDRKLLAEAYEEIYVPNKKTELEEARDEFDNADKKALSFDSTKIEKIQADIDSAKVLASFLSEIK